jgi:hypothetical protein
MNVENFKFYASLPLEDGTKIIHFVEHCYSPTACDTTAFPADGTGDPEHGAILKSELCQLVDREQIIKSHPQVWEYIRQHMAAVPDFLYSYPRLDLPETTSPTDA